MNSQADPVGRRLPSGTFEITPEEERRLVAALGGTERDDGTAHPIWCYLATQRGVGISVADLLKAVDFDIADGPMLGSSEMRYGSPLKVGVTYSVSGEIVSLEHKSGRRTGAFDLLTCVERLVDPDGDEAAAITNVFVLPRGASS